MIISDKRLQQALNFMSNNASTYGARVGKVEGTYRAMKAIEAVSYLATTGTVDERKGRVQDMDAVKTAINDHENAIAAREELRIKLDLEKAVISCWQTENANRWVGIV